MKIFDSKGGAQPEAAEQFINAAWQLIATNAQNDYRDAVDVTVTIGDLKLVAYDNAQLISSLLSAIQDYKNDID